MPRKGRLTWKTEKAPFPTRLRIALAEGNISQKVLADFLGIKRQTVSQYCLGQSAPDFKTLCKIADYFELSSDYLLGRTDVKTTETTLRSVCDYTGLSEKTVENLHFNMQAYGKTFSRCISKVISNLYFNYFLNSILRLLLLKDSRTSEIKQNVEINMLRTRLASISDQDNTYDITMIEPPFSLLEVAEWQAAKAAQQIIESLVKEESEETTILGGEIHIKDETSEIDKTIMFMRRYSDKEGTVK